MPSVSYTEVLLKHISQEYIASHQRMHRIFKYTMDREEASDIETLSKWGPMLKECALYFVVFVCIVVLATWNLAQK